MKNLLVRLAASGALAATMGAGLAHASAGAQMYGRTGGNGSDSSSSQVSNSVTVANNSAPQNAHSGNATVEGNTFGGSAVSGSVKNSNSTSTTVNIASQGVGQSSEWNRGGSATIDTTGPGSSNQINFRNSSQARQTTTNTVTITNNSSVQNVHSGNATVEGNTFGGSAVSGSVENSSSTSTSVSITATARGQGSGNGWIRNGTGGGFNASISNTGPGSFNSITVNGRGPSGPVAQPSSYNFPPQPHNLFNRNPWSAMGTAGFSRKFGDQGNGRAMGGFTKFPPMRTVIVRSSNHMIWQPCAKCVRVVSFRTIRPPCQPPVINRCQVRCCQSPCCQQTCCQPMPVPVCCHQQPQPCHHQCHQRPHHHHPVCHHSSSHCHYTVCCR